MASNGINDLGKFDFVSDGMYPGSQIDHSYYADATQVPLGAQAVQADYDPQTNPLTGEPVSRFSKGGISAIPKMKNRGIAALHFDGTEGSQVEEPAAWNPESGQVILQQPVDPKDPFSEMKNTDYTIPKDQIKTFIPNINQDTGLPNGSGAYVLKDGSTLGVDNFGVVSAATPGRNDYTLNKEGYYQPTGENLTWNGGLNQLTKKIGGVDIQVPGIYNKGGYQDANGNLRVNEDGVPVPLAPNYLDSGAGKSGLADAAPYIAIAAMTAATMGAGATGFAGMVPASETLLGSMGALGATSAVPLSEITGSTFSAPAFALPESAATTAGGITALGADAGGATIGATGGDAVVGGSTASQLPSLSYTVPEIGGSYVAPGTVGAMNAALPAGATVGAEGTALGATVGGGTGAMSAAIPAGTVIGTGEAGTTLGATYLAGANGLPATTALGTPILASSVGVGGTAATAGMSAKDAFLAYQGLNMLRSSLGGNQTAASGQGGPSTTTTTTPHTTTTPAMFNMPTPLGSAYTPYTYAYNPRDFGARAFAHGGPTFDTGGIASLGSYSDGGQLLKGPGDGMSDDIPASIGQDQPARLADGEFVIPADVVSHLGNGSTDAGAKHLYKMMDRIRQARTGNHKQGKKINPEKFLPKG